MLSCNLQAFLFSSQHFFRKEPVVGIEYEAQLQKTFLPRELHAAITIFICNSDPLLHFRCKFKLHSFWVWTSLMLHERNIMPSDVVLFSGLGESEQTKAVSFN